MGILILLFRGIPFIYIDVWWCIYFVRVRGNILTEGVISGQGRGAISG
jgi:hypothetical protein